MDADAQHKRPRFVSLRPERVVSVRNSHDVPCVPMGRPAVSPLRQLGISNHESPIMGHATHSNKYELLSAAPDIHRQ